MLLLEYEIRFHSVLVVLALHENTVNWIWKGYFTNSLFSEISQIHFFLPRTHSKNFLKNWDCYENNKQTFRASCVTFSIILQKEAFFRNNSSISFGKIWPRLKRKQNLSQLNKHKQNKRIDSDLDWNESERLSKRKR